MTIENMLPKLTELLKTLISIPSFSKAEDDTASCIEAFLEQHGVSTFRHKNNVWALSNSFDSSKQTLLLNSHHDTVRPHSGYTNDPFEAKVENGKLYGLGSNDAGGALVCLLGAFLLLKEANLSVNLVFSATAEEENSGENGIAALLSILPPIDMAIVGEPTSMQVAIAEKGLLVIDGYASGVSGHAAHESSVSAINMAANDIVRIQQFQFPKQSTTLGKMKATVTQINAGTQHNVVPETCHFVIDVRTTDAYSNEEAFHILDEFTESELKARSFRLNSSWIDDQHNLVKTAKKIGLKTYGSPTISDQALLNIPSIKLGPGDSVRSHSANEFICLHELEKGLRIYKQLIENL